MTLKWRAKQANWHCGLNFAVFSFVIEEGSDNVATLFSDVFYVCQRILPEVRNIRSPHASCIINNTSLPAFNEKIEQIIGMLQVLRTNYQIEREYEEMVVTLENILLSYHHKIQRLTMMERRYECRKQYTSKPGRPAFFISYEQVEGLVSLGFSWKRIAELLGVSDRTLRRWRRDCDFTFTFSEIGEEALDNIIRRKLQSSPSMGERLLTGA